MSVRYRFEITDSHHNIEGTVRRVMKFLVMDYELVQDKKYKEVYTLIVDEDDIIMMSLKTKFGPGDIGLAIQSFGIRFAGYYNDHNYC